MVKAVKNDSVVTAVLEDKAQPSEIPQQTMKPKKVRISAEISGDVADRIKNAVYWTPGMTMAGFIEESSHSHRKVRTRKRRKVPSERR
jgi:hypothetical protein